MIVLLIHALTMVIHFSHGPNGFVFYTQPPHIAAGAGFVQGHLIGWWEIR